MTMLENSSATGSLLAAIFADETFIPAEPGSIEETGLSPTLVEALICKYVLVVGSASGRQIAEQICLPFGTLEGLFRVLRQRQIIVHSSSAQMNDYNYVLTDQGRQFAQRLMETCAYVGPAPVPLMDYIVSVEAQTIRAEAPKQQHLAKAFADISVEAELLDQLGPAINSGAGLFLYGAPGNGKTTLAARITMCFGQDIWIPKTLTEDGQLIKLYDGAYHRSETCEREEPVEEHRPRSPLDQDSSADRHRGRRADARFARNPPRSGEQRERSASAAQEQLRLFAGRRLRPTAH